MCQNMNENGKLQTIEKHEQMEHEQRERTDTNWLNIVGEKLLANALETSDNKWQNFNDLSKRTKF